MFSIILKFYKNHFIKLINEWGQFAWLQGLWFPSNYQRLNIKQSLIRGNSYDHSRNINRSGIYNNKDNFYQWLVGFTDGDGTFSLSLSDSKWQLIFKIGQSNYNLRVLYFIKKQLGYGSIYCESKSNNAAFRIADRKVLKKMIFPIFDKYPLLTSKQFDYLKVKRAYEILENSSLSKQEKDVLLFELRNAKKSMGFISSAWKIINYQVDNIEDIKSVMSKYWLIGFTEAEGSFYLVKKEDKRLVHAFEITQKLDLIVLVSIGRILGINVRSKKTYNTIVTTNSRAISNIIDYYKDTMKGMKALEYRIWSKSFLNFKGNYNELNKVRELMRNIRSIRLDKNGSIQSITP